jgi:chromosome segregation ATPase
VLIKRAAGEAEDEAVGDDYEEQLEDAESRAEVVAELLAEAKGKVARACSAGVAVQGQLAELEKQEKKLRAALVVSNAATLHQRIEAQLPKLELQIQQKSKELSDLQRLAARGDGGERGSARLALLSAARWSRSSRPEPSVVGPFPRPPR